MLRNYLAVAFVSSAFTSAAIYVTRPKETPTATTALPCCSGDIGERYNAVIDGYKEVVGKLADENSRLREENCKLKKRDVLIEGKLMGGKLEFIPPQNLPTVPADELPPTRKVD